MPEWRGKCFRSGFFRASGERPQPYKSIRTYAECTYVSLYVYSLA